MKLYKKRLIIAVFLLILFILWTIAVSTIDVQPIGPNGSSVGFASINAKIHRATGVHFMLYTVTDRLSFIPIFMCAGFALLGSIQCIQSRSIRKVDSSLLMLGGYYILVISIYILFEIFPVNYRPVLIDGILEASYPSSTTMLVLCVMPTAMMQLHIRIKKAAVKRFLFILCTIFLLLMIMLRMISGVHWFTDIVASILLSSALTLMYASVTDLSCK